MKVHKLTEWEMGQELIKAYDVLADVEREIREQFPSDAKVVQSARISIAKWFNKRGTHEFGLGEKEIK